jgi:hypothetical protein
MRTESAWGSFGMSCSVCGSMMCVSTGSRIEKAFGKYAPATSDQRLGRLHWMNILHLLSEPDTTRLRITGEGNGDQLPWPADTLLATMSPDG